MTQLLSSCRQVEHLLSLRATDDLTADETAKIDQHVRYCEPCRSVLTALAEATAVLREAGAAPAACEARPSLWERIEPRLGPAGRLRRRSGYWIPTWQLAAACLALLALTWLIERRPTGVEAGPTARPRVAGEFVPAAIQSIRPALGVLVQAVDVNLANRLQLDSTCGAVVADVAPDSPADRAGLQAGDVIVGCNRQRIHSPQQLGQMVAVQTMGAVVELDVVRAGWQTRVKVRLDAR